jgi:hypothetical protein
MAPHDRGSATTVIPVRRRGDESALFRSFWIGGFESASHINQAGLRIDMVSATQHDHLVDEDYSRLAEWGIQTVREGTRWHLIETGRGFDFASLEATGGRTTSTFWVLGLWIGLPVTAEPWPVTSTIVPRVPTSILR